MWRNTFTVSWTLYFRRFLLTCQCLSWFPNSDSWQHLTQHIHCVINICPSLYNQCVHIQSIYVHGPTLIEAAFYGMHIIHMRCHTLLHWPCLSLPRPVGLPPVVEYAALVIIKVSTGIAHTYTRKHNKQESTARFLEYSQGHRVLYAYFSGGNRASVWSTRHCGFQ